MPHKKTTPSTNQQSALRASRLLAIVAVAALLQACGTGIKPSWIEAPLVADAYTDDVGYFSRESRLQVNRRVSTQLKFNYATLPSGSLSKLNVDTKNTSASVGQENYSLNASKVASARLVLYVDKVTAPGYLQISSAHRAGADCFPHEDDKPTGCDQIVTSTTGTAMTGALATDADDPSHALRITERGFYSFDVTQLVKNRLDNNTQSMIVVSAVPNPGANPTDPDSVYGSFDFASKEQQPLGAQAMRQPQLLISLTDAAGSTYRSIRATSVRQSSTDPSVAGENFDRSENLWMSGATDNRAYALIESSPLNTGGATLRSVFNTTGSLKGKQSLILFVNAPVQDQPVAQPEVVFYKRGSFYSNNNRVRSWNDGWTPPTAQDQFAAAVLDRSAPNQQLLIDTSTPYITALVSGYNANLNAPDVAYTGTTTLQQPLSLDSDDNARTAHGPRLVSVLVDESDPDNSLFGGLLSFNKHDSSYALSFRNYRTGAPSALSARARLGQLFANQGNPLFVNPWAEGNSASQPYATPINIVLPTSGASATMVEDRDTTTQSLSADMGGYLGYSLNDARANRSVGRYQGIVSMPGHNLRTVIEFENLPLPVPTLSGPATVVTPLGSTVITMGANAPVPLQLNVVDPVGEHIDDTTKWIITSSNSADTMPGVIRQTDGSAAFAATFSGLGVRTLTVTSQGDSSITATLDVTVKQETLTSQVITFTTSPPAEAVVGGSYTVAAKGGASGNPVVFTVEGTCTVAGNVVNFVGTGTCTINADQAGNATYAPAERVQQAFAIELPRLVVTTTSLGTLQVGKAYSLALTASGGVPPYTWTAKDSGKLLPAGLSLSAGGVLSGTPTTAGDYTSLVTVIDSSVAPQVATQRVGFVQSKAAGVSASQVFSGTVATAGAVTVTPVPTLNQWALLLLSIALVGFVAVGGRRAWPVR